MLKLLPKWTVFKRGSAEKKNHLNYFFKVFTLAFAAAPSARARQAVAESRKLIMVLCCN